MATDPPADEFERATLAGGCFWCLEAVFEEVAGVTRVVSGYAGGATPNPDYQSVCSGRTGHAEVAQLTFAPAQISYREILEIFFAIHDPTTLNRQGNDVGTQYRSAIYHHSPQQRAQAQALLDEFSASNAFGAPVVTELKPIETFFPAESDHQSYYRHHSEQPYCQFVVAPKLAKFRQRFAARRKAD